MRLSQLHLYTEEVRLAAGADEFLSDTWMEIKNSRERSKANSESEEEETFLHDRNYARFYVISGVDESKSLLHFPLLPFYNLL